MENKNNLEVLIYKGDELIESHSINKLAEYHKIIEEVKRHHDYFTAQVIYSTVEVITTQEYKKVITAIR